MADFFVVGGIDILQLNDDELFDRLKSFGVDVGPVLDTTRSVYQRKLAKLMRGESEPLPESGDGDYNGEDDDDYVPYTPPESPEYPDHLRHRVGLAEQAFTPLESPRQAGSPYPDYKYSSISRDSPSVRPSIHDAHTSHKLTADDLVSQAVEEVPSSPQGSGLLTKLGILLVLAVVAFLIYNSIESNPLPQIPDHTTAKAALPKTSRT